MKEAGAFGEGNRTKVGIVGWGWKKMHSGKRERELAKPNLSFSVCGRGCIGYILAEIFLYLQLDM